MAKAGRPKADVTKEKIVSIRMKPEDYDKLKEYAYSSEMTVTEVVQKGVSLILDGNKADGEQRRRSPSLSGSEAEILDGK